MEQIIHIENLKKVFGEKTAVNIDNLTINKGEIIGLVGNNGAGKTTFFRLILDLLKADDGCVALKEGINPALSEEWKAFTGAYIDEGFLIDFLTPEEYFEFIGKVCGLTKQQTEEKLALYEQFMAGEVLGQKKLIRDYSAGNKHKIGIIAALLNTPELLILDEPFNFLDPSSQNHLKKLLKDYNQETGATIIVSSHNLQHTTDISTRIILLEQGKVRYDIENTNNSANELLESYFNS